MYRIVIHENIQRITEFLYRVGFWSRLDEDSVRDRGLKLFHSTYFSLFVISMAVGAVTNDDKRNTFFILLMSCVVLMKLLYLLWKKNKILELLNQICDYGIDDRGTYNAINDKSTALMNFTVFFLSMTTFTLSSDELVAPFVGTKRKLFFQIGFPLDWRNTDLGFWMAFMFLITEAVIAMIALSFSVFVWYLMANCGWRITDKLILFMFGFFVVILTTSAVCICMSAYSLTFNRGDSSVELVIYLGFLMYCIFDIFMIMYFGNEIQLASGRLSYNLYESNWIEQSHSIKMNVTVFGEFLMQPHKLMILKMYPLTLDTFKTILNSAYSMFNILQNVK